MHTSGNKARMWGGKIYYFSGGTTHIPRIIEYDFRKWNNSITRTSQILGEHGVNSNSRVVVCHPFAPWSIGDNFSQSCLKLNSKVYPIGLYINEPNFLYCLQKIQPTHFCGTARNLIKLKLELNKRNISINSKVESIFVAGEVLTDAIRARCESIWSSNVVNIYGMSEFDTIGSEFNNNRLLCLTPSLEYRLLQRGQIIQLKEDSEGELLIREHNEKFDSKWFKSGDKFRVVKKNTLNNHMWSNTWMVKFLSRTNEAIFLSDGSLIGSHTIDRILETFKEIDVLQIQLIHRNEGDYIRILYVPINPNSTISSSKMINTFLNNSIDIHDSYKHNIIKEIKVKRTKLQNLTKSIRGKIPRLIELDKFDC